MVFGGGFVSLLVIGFVVWAIFDVITTDESQCRNLPKFVWLMLVILLSVLGALAWLLLGRPENASLRIGDTSPGGPSRRPIGPEDRAGWSPSGRERSADPNRYAEMDIELDRRIEEKRLREWEAELGRREDELKRHEDAPED